MNGMSTRDLSRDPVALQENTDPKVPGDSFQGFYALGTCTIPQALDLLDPALIIYQVERGTYMGNRSDAHVSRRKRGTGVAVALAHGPRRENIKMSGRGDRGSWTREILN